LANGNTNDLASAVQESVNIVNESIKETEEFNEDLNNAIKTDNIPAESELTKVAQIQNQTSSIRDLIEKYKTEDNGDKVELLELIEIMKRYLVDLRKKRLQYEQDLRGIKELRKMGDSAKLKKMESVQTKRINYFSYSIGMLIDAILTRDQGMIKEAAFKIKESLEKDAAQSHIIHQTLIELLDKAGIPCSEDIEFQDISNILDQSEVIFSEIPESIPDNERANRLIAKFRGVRRIYKDELTRIKEKSQDNQMSKDLEKSAKDDMKLCDLTIGSLKRVLNGDSSEEAISFYNNAEIIFRKLLTNHEAFRKLVNNFVEGYEETEEQKVGNEMEVKCYHILDKLKFQIREQENKEKILNEVAERIRDDDTDATLVNIWKSYSDLAFLFTKSADKAISIYDDLQDSLTRNEERYEDLEKKYKEALDIIKLMNDSKIELVFKNPSFHFLRYYSPDIANDLENLIPTYHKKYFDHNWNDREKECELRPSAKIPPRKASKLPVPPKFSNPSTSRTQGPRFTGCKFQQPSTSARISSTSRGQS
jgi:hypothetical protein